MEFEINSSVPQNWRIYRIEDVCQRITSGGTPRRNEPRFYQNGRFAWVKTQELNDGWIYDTEEHITEDAVRNSSAKILPKNTVLMAMYGATVGQLGILAKEMCCNQACCAMIVTEKMADARYLFYLLRSQRERIKSLASGAAQQNLSGLQIKNFKLPFPPLPEQRAIADVLGALDDKIELNRRMNETLEGLARALFKSWFVDGVGEEWEEKELGEIFEIKRDALNPANFDSEQFDYYSIPAFDNGKIPDKEIGGNIKSNKFLVPDDIVLLSKLNPDTPRVWLPFVSQEMRSICSTEFLVVKSHGVFPREYIYSLFCSDAFTQQFSTMVTGTSGSHQRVKPESLLKMSIIAPPQNTAQEFAETIKPVLRRVHSNSEQSRTLAALRDALLPRLMSGEVRVKDKG